MRQINRIVVHCTATPPSFDKGAFEVFELHTSPKTVKIQWGNIMISGKGWSDNGYHAVILRNGRVENGRPVERAGAHARGFNEGSLAVVLYGGIDEDGIPDFNYTVHQMESLKRWLDVAKNEYPHAVVEGHRDLPGVNKACPCFDVKEWYV